jgi:serine/threonine protein kinase
MTPDELRRVRQIFEQALLMSNYTRPAFLDRECEGNPELRRDVEGLLNARERVPYWLDLPVVGAVTPDVPDMAGRSLGSYTLLREIGRGGMGIVYLAERSDGAFQKQVAVKLVLPRPGMSEIIARFRREREILARLDHPNIARLLDGGVTEEAWPYFVMEFVEGQPINVWCDEKKLTISERISLFRYILAAVQYAHQRLVVHRDLKPGNIFVTKDGRSSRHGDSGTDHDSGVRKPGAGQGHGDQHFERCVFAGSDPL